MRGGAQRVLRGGGGRRAQLVLPGAQRVVRGRAVCVAGGGRGQLVVQRGGRGGGCATACAWQGACAQRLVGPCAQRLVMQKKARVSSSFRSPRPPTSECLDSF